MACKEYEDYMKNLGNVPKVTYFRDNKEITLYFKGEKSYDKIKKDDILNCLLPKFLDQMK